MHGILQARILGWGVGFSRPRDQIHTSMSLALQADSLLLSHQGRPYMSVKHSNFVDPAKSQMFRSCQERTDIIYFVVVATDLQIRHIMLMRNSQL